MAREVCVLSDYEVEAFLNNKLHPKCDDHGHISPETAWELVDGKYTQGPAAEWIGPRHVRLIDEYTWKVKHTMKLENGEVIRMSTMQFVKKGKA